MTSSIEALTIALVLIVLLGAGVWIGLALILTGWFTIWAFTSSPPGMIFATTAWEASSNWTLTALPLIFAVFLATPAPICVLDEVDAPLDDANVGRFCDLLDEMTRRTDTRFLIITHHAVTMSRMDRLFGVTMVEQGVSQLVSVDLRRAEALVA